MIEDYEKQKQKRLVLRRSLMDYAIGTFIIVLGIFFLTRQMFAIDFNKRFPPNSIDKIFGAICLLYGGWRIYRGYKKNYFK